MLCCDVKQNLSFGCIFVLAIVFGLIYICFTTEEGENREDDASQKRRRRMREGRPKVYPAKSVAAPASSLSPGSMSPDDMEGAQPRIAPAPQSSDDQTGGAATNLSIERSARLSCRSFAAKLWSMIQRTSPRRKADLCAAFFVLAAYITAVTVIVMRPISKSSPPDYFA